MNPEDFLGDKPGVFCATLVRRVLELAIDEGVVDDPRHRDHWWPWHEWTLDGRQWTTKGGGGGSNKLDKSAVAEHKQRKQMPGCHGSMLKVEKKLEGIIWNADKPRTELRSLGAFDADMFARLPDDGDEDEEDSVDSGDDSDFGDDNDDDTAMSPVLYLAHAVQDFKNRHAWDASVLKNGVLGNVDLGDDAHVQFRKERPFVPFLQRYGEPVTSDSDLEEKAKLQSVIFYRCTDAFPTRDEQRKIQNKEVEDERGTPSVSVEAYCTYYDPETGNLRIVFVVAEAPIPKPHGVFVDTIFDRVSGFVFFKDDGVDDGLPVAQSPDSATAADMEHKKSVIRAAYVEACDCDYEAMSDSQKDALFEDRALVLHQLVDQCVKPEAKAVLNPLSVRTPPYGSKVAAGFPPSRTLACYYGVGRPDPRWPLVPPNSVCLECGKGPKHEDEEMRVETLLQCSKCRVRKFCSKECMVKSWKSKIWSHRYECNKAQEYFESQVGLSPRQQFREIFQTHDTINPQAERVLEQEFEKVNEGYFDRVVSTVEELHASNKKNRAQRRKKRKDKRKK